MKKLNFITIGDKKYFCFINQSAKNISKFYPNSTIYIYDWGFTSFQKKILNKYKIVKIIDWKDKFDIDHGYKTIISEYEGYNPSKDIRQNEYLLNQKPICILDCAQRIDENLIFIDGDAILINRIDEIFGFNFNIGVTMNDLNDIKRSKSLKIYSPINSGVIFFRAKSDLIQLFIREWIKQIKITKRIWIEQSALALLISRNNPSFFEKSYNEGKIFLSNKTLKTKTFPSQIYNFYKLESGFDVLKTKILHFKGRTSRERIKEIIVEYKLNYFIPKVLKIFPKPFRYKLIPAIKIPKIAKFISQTNKIEKIKRFIIRILKNKKIFTTFKDR